MKLTSCRDAQDVARRCADQLQAVVATDPEAVLILPAGNTPRPLFAELVRRQDEGQLDLRRVHVVQLDELVGVAPADPRSFHAFLRDHLLDPLGRDGSRDHLMRGDAVDPDAEIARHAGALQRLGPVDLSVLGIGLNGHVAFNEPGTRLEDGARRLPLAPATAQTLVDAFAPDERPTEGITLGLAELNASRAVRILATGASKASILERLFQEPPSSDLPASLLGGHADVEVLADEAAKGALAARP